MLANRGLPEVEVIKVDDAHTEIALTLLRCVGWLSRDDMAVRQGHAGPAFETPGGQLLGKWSYDYAIIPHKGDWHKAYQQAYAFELSLRAIETDLHKGENPFQGAFISHSPDEFIISAVKESENGKGWIVRGYNISSETIQLNLKPMRHFANAMHVNLAEEEISALNAGEDGSIMISVSGHEIVSILFL
jgi:alpha-mannosidase